MSRLALVAILCLALAVPASEALGAPAPAPVNSAKKKCKKGYRLVTVKKHGKRKKVCKKKPAKGPSVAVVEKQLRDYFTVLYGNNPGAEDYPVDVTFTRPTKVFPQEEHDFDGIPNNGPGIPSWPVAAWIHIVVHESDEDEEENRGCLNHLNRVALGDELFYFFKSAAGGLDWRTSTAACPK